VKRYLGCQCTFENPFTPSTHSSSSLTSFLMEGGEGITRLPKKSSWFLLQLLYEFVFLLTRWQYVLPLLLNFCGSILFFKTLGDAGNDLMRGSGSSISEVTLNFFFFLLLFFLFLVLSCSSSLFLQEISLVVPIANSLTFIFTTLTGKLLGEAGINYETYLGMFFVLVGVSTCLSSKVV
jgi:hypothetical protein